MKQTSTFILMKGIADLTLNMSWRMNVHFEIPINGPSSL